MCVPRNSQRVFRSNALGLLVPMATSMISAVAGLIVANILDGGAGQPTDRDFLTSGEVVGGAFAASVAVAVLRSMSR